MAGCLRCGFLLRGGLVAGYLAEDEAFEEGIGAEAICAVKAVGGDFAAGVEIFDARLALGVGLYAADHIVCAWPHGDEVFAHVDIETFA